MNNLNNNDMIEQILKNKQEELNRELNNRKLYAQVVSKETGQPLAEVSPSKEGTETLERINRGLENITNIRKTTPKEEPKILDPCAECEQRQERSKKYKEDYIESDTLCGVCGNPQVHFLADLTQSEQERIYRENRFIYGTR